MLKSLKKALWDKFLKNFRNFGLLLSIIYFFHLSCTPQEEVITPEFNASLNFSADTVLFDTIFSSVGSLTKRIKIYNRNINAVNISNISLGLSSASPYTIFLNGEPGANFNDTYLLGGDSLMILVTVNIDPQDQNLPYLVKDSIVFNTNGQQQDIKLIAYGQDAHFIGNSILPCNTVWTADRPYVIYKSILIDSLCNLTIEKGARIYFNYNSALYVKGSLKVAGEKEQKVIFRNERMDGSYKNSPGQWLGIFFLEGSKDNYIDFAEIRNANYGIRMGTPDDDDIPDLILSNTIIENMTSAGILCFTSDLSAFNVLVNNCGDYTVGNFAGGNYSYNHCTFANYNFMFFRQDPSVVFSDNIILANNSILTADLSVNIHNSIVWGTLKDEIILSNAGGSVFTFFSSHNILRTTNGELGIKNNILNSENVNFPRFKKPEEHIFLLDTLSPAKDAGVPSEVVFDLQGEPRSETPDIGAYERKE
ncbi:hypothetical protein BH23BAC1_BH23BAC1_45220 [soil metagenome]